MYIISGADNPVNVVQHLCGNAPPFGRENDDSFVLYSTSFSFSSRCILYEGAVGVNLV
jgi:hypothetical protein